jgi:PKD repeat protein
MKKLFTLMVLMALSALLSQSLFAQRSIPMLPHSNLYEDLRINTEIKAFPAPDMAAIEAEDLANPSPYRVAVSVPVNLSMENAGQWTELPDGGKIWTLSIEVEGAQALGVYYDNFWLPYGGELYLYNEDKTQILGAYTDENNNPECVFANQLVQGDIVTLEYYQPESQIIEPIISISDVAYNYRGFQFEVDPNRGGSLWCMINVNCPEGDDWQDEKRGVVKQYMKIGWGYYLCTGSLMNTTEQDLTPYILTAWHCGEGATASDYNQWIFYFNYEASACTGNWGPANNTMTGCAKKAEGNYTTGSDFLLLELNYGVPANYNAYYNGWDRSNFGADSGVGIHHPAGDIKKISTYTIPLTSSPWNNNGVLSHWKAWWAETVNGTSITEGGSSGSPLFSETGHVVGDLTGGPPDDCQNPLYSLYGKIYWSWDKMGTLSSQQLKPWLDPGNYAPYTWDGTYDGEETVPDFSADQTNLQTGDIVEFQNLTTGNPLEWEWTFEGGDPSSFTGETPPEVTYNDPGVYDVTLTATNTLGSNTKDSVGMIVVGAPAADFSSENNYILAGESVNFTDQSSGDPTEWTWTFTGGEPETSTEQNPEGIEYAEDGTYAVKLVVTNQYATDSTIKEDFVTVGGPFADFEADQTSILTGESVTFTDLSINNPDAWSWRFFGGSPGTFNGQEPPAIVYNNSGSYNVRLSVSNDMGTHVLNKSSYIVVGAVNLDEPDQQFDVKVFPNPSEGILYIELNNDAEEVALKVNNSIGERIYNAEIHHPDNRITVDISDHPAGVYMMMIKIDGNTYLKKITLTD